MIFANPAFIFSKGDIQDPAQLVFDFPIPNAIALVLFTGDYIVNVTRGKRFFEKCATRIKTNSLKGVFPVSDTEQQLHQLTFQEVSLKNELSSLGEAVNICAVEDCESKVVEFLVDLKVGVDELKTVAPQTPEEQHEVFLVKKRAIDTLVERIQIDRERNLQVQIRLNLLEIIGKDAQNETTAAVHFREGETYTHTHDICHAGQLCVQL